MKILYIITALGTGGAENLLVDVCKGLVPKNEICVVFLRDKRDFEKELNDIGIETIFVDLENMGSLKVLFALKKIIKEKQSDIVHTHLPAADVLGRLAGLLSKNVKVFTSVHNTELWKQEKNLKSAILRVYNRFTVNCLKKSSYIAVSNSVKEYCIETEKIRSDKISVLYNFIDVQNPKKTQADFKPDFSVDGKFVLIAVARLHFTKGHIYLLEALNKLVHEKAMDDLFLIVLGDGESREELENYVKEHGLGEHVRFMGIVKNVYDYMRMSNLLVLPSIIEGFGLAFLEAHYCRIPVLGSDIKIIREVLHNGENGVMFKTTDPVDLADKIEKIRAGEYELDKKIEAGYEFCMSLTKEGHVHDLLEIYKR